MRGRLPFAIYCRILTIVFVLGYGIDTAPGGIDDATPYNSAEFYDQIREKRRVILAEQRANVDLREHARFRTVVSENKQVLRVDRLTYWFEVNKANGVVDKVGLLDIVAAEQCACGDLEIVDSRGQIYRQSRSQGKVTVRDEPTYLFWTARFSPTDDRGTKSEVTIEASYQMFKISGLVTVRYRVLEGAAKVTKLSIRNSLGLLPVNLSIAHSAFFLNNEGKFNDTLTVRSNDFEDEVLATGKIVAPFWTDGRIGLHATALQQTWRQMGPLDADSSLKRTVIRTVNKQRRIDFFFINTKSPVSLEPGKEFESSFAFLPFQHYQPRIARSS